VIDDAISIGGVNLADPSTYSEGMPYEAFRKLRERAPVAWHPYKDGPGFLALTGYDEVLAVRQRRRRYRPTSASRSRRVWPLIWKSILDTRVLIAEDMVAAPTPLVLAQVECYTRRSAASRHPSRWRGAATRM
jgi:hypothetical protein